METNVKLGDNCIQNFHLGGISLNIRLAIQFYGDTQAELYNLISNRISDDIPQMKF